MPDVELLPCPFCGGEARYAKALRRNKQEWIYIQCNECGVKSSPRKSVEEAEKIWNRRKPEVWELKIS